MGYFMLTNDVNNIMSSCSKKETHLVYSTECLYNKLELEIAKENLNSLFIEKKLRYLCMIFIQVVLFIVWLQFSN